MQKAFYFKLIILFTLVFLVSKNTFSQIVNIEDKRSTFTDSVGWFETGSLSGQWKKNKTEIFNVRAGFQVEFQYKKRILLSISNINFARADNKNFINEGFQHLRYTRLINKRWGFEAFGQAQYNEQLSLRLRILFGTGARLNICQKNSKCNLGLSAMYEYDEESKGEIIQKDFRLNSYFSASIPIAENINLYSTTYYQPLVTDFNDFRLSSQSKMVLGITKKLSATITFSILYDSRAPIDSPELSEDLYGGLKYKF
ncbi:MAG TPA: DUF481 domain-containing protein [Bacteroidetes bacterium]|nr:DUF481 domain-containing protein [Bacteroidota bacterium]